MYPSTKISSVTPNNKTSNQLERHKCYKQQGSTLIIALIILMVLSLLGVTSMSVSSMQEKMVGNMRDQNIAFNAAEAALRDAEAYVETLASTGAFDTAGTNGLYATGVNPDVFASATWAAGVSRAYSGAVTGVTTQPRYIIEAIGSVGVENLNVAGYGESNGQGMMTSFRITAKGTGTSDSSRVLLQTYYARRL